MIAKQSVVLSVSQLNNQAKYILEKNFPDINVRGEISSLKHYPSGYSYFSIKDNRSEISCVALPNTPEIEKLKVGLEFDFNAVLSIYIPKGKFQLLIKSFKQNQEGPIWAKYIDLKNKLKTEGLFESRHKRNIASYPFSIGIISSSEGAVIHDICKVFKRRAPHINLYLKHSQVQGDESVDDIIKGIDYFNNHYNLDALLIARGGGSFEDLNCFNNENLCRHIFDSETPVVTAIGHETDFTISDFVSDLSASTPSVAAEILSESSRGLSDSLKNNVLLIQNLADNRIKLLNNENNHLKNRLSVDYIRQIVSRISDQKENLDRIINISVKNKIADLNRKISSYKKSLDSNNIGNILEKGFGLIKDENNNVISKTKMLRAGQKVSINFIDGKVRAKIIEK